MSPLLVDPKLRRAALDPRLLAWTLYRAALWPVVKAKALARRYRGSDPRYLLHPSPGRPSDLGLEACASPQKGTHMAFVGPGFGEYVMLKRVADRLRETSPEVVVSYALRDADAVEAVRSLDPSASVSWLNPESYRSVLRWLAAQRPDVLVLSENYRYPTLLAAATRFGARAFLMNGRRRPRKALENRALSWHHRWMISMLSGMGMQTQAYADVARTLAPSGCEIRITGDIKTDIRIVPLASERDAELRAWLASDLPLVAAGSTDGPVEEAMVVAAFLKARAVAPCRLLVAPRRMTKLNELLELLGQAGLTYRTRASNDPEADVLVLDTQGELASAYRACAAVYVGGSYLPSGGGHNVIEPLAWGVPVAYGVQRGNFEAIQRLVEEAGVGTRIRGEDELAAFWTRFLRDAATRTHVGETARRLVEENRGAVDRTVEMLARLLPRRVSISVEDARERNPQAVGAG